MSDALERLGLYVVKDFLDAEECARLVEEVSAARGGPATVYRPGAASPVDESLRRTTRHMLSPETTERVRRRLLGRKEEVAAHFGLPLHDCEDPQFLRYREGDFFVAHQDGNTGMLRAERESRLISVVIFLSRQADGAGGGDYGGGSLVFSDWRPGSNRGVFRVAGEPGALVAFRAETTHEVTPVTHGERLSIACWYM